MQCILAKLKRFETNRHKVGTVLVLSDEYIHTVSLSHQVQDVAFRHQREFLLG